MNPELTNLPRLNRYLWGRKSLANLVHESPAARTATINTTPIGLSGRVDGLERIKDTTITHERCTWLRRRRGP